MHLFAKTIRFLCWSLFAGICALVLICASVYLYLSPALPDVESLKDWKLQTPMRILSADNQLIAEYGEQRRAPLRYEEVPTLFVQALIAIEDKRFEQHRGVDPIRFAKVVMDVLVTGDKDGAGGSTLTQQVARNYFLSLQKTFTRKFTEILLALKMESELSKKEIFELYINKHYLGQRAYGIQAAATAYYGKDINDLTLPQLAMIAGLYQAPSGANPIANPSRAVTRRNTVLWLMRDNQFISEAQYQLARSQPLTARYHGNNPDFNAWYLAEMVSNYMVDRFGTAAYSDGYRVYTTINSELQQAAGRGVRRTLIDYSRRHGYLGPEQFFSAKGNDPYERLQSQLQQLNATPEFGGLVPALVVAGDRLSLSVIAKGETSVTQLSLESISWARKRITVDRVGDEISHPYQVAVPGDMVRLEKTDQGWQLAQVPRAQGALIALSPLDGSIQAVVGGFDFLLSKFNRAVQATRQPGSNFKPFLYSAALEKGYTPATIVNDAPIVRADSSLEDVWRPKNSGDRYLGPIPLRQALYQSRNLSSIRVLNDIGINYARNYASRFGFSKDQLSQDLTLMLGSTAASPLQIAAGFAVFANGGYAVEPYFINRIEDKDGNIVFEAAPTLVCRGCQSSADTYIADEGIGPIDITPLELNVVNDDDSVITKPVAQERRYAEQVLSPQTAFLMDSMLKDVIQRGTGRAARQSLQRSDIAGKTGTTNDAVDAWFTGYNSDVVASAWVGYDSNASLGAREFGGKAALPAWIEFMQTALANKPETNLPQPVGIIQVRVDPLTGLLALPDTENAYFEYFTEESVPTEFSSGFTGVDFSGEGEATTLPDSTGDTAPSESALESLF